MKIKLDRCNGLKNFIDQSTNEVPKIETGMIVCLRYKNIHFHVFVTNFINEKESSNKFSGEVKSTPDDLTDVKDISVGEIIYFSYKDICYISSNPIQE